MGINIYFVVLLIIIHVDYLETREKVLDILK